MDNSDVKEKVMKLQKAFVEAMTVIKDVEEMTQSVPDGVFFIALAGLVRAHKDNKVFQEAQRLYEVLEAEQKRLTTN